MAHDPHLLIARPIPADLLQPLRALAQVEMVEHDAPLSQPELIQRLQGKHALFATGTELIDAHLLSQCPDLKCVALMTVGYNNVDLQACTARGVQVSNAPDVLTETTADFAFALMMAAARRVTEAEHFLRAGQWQHWGVDLFAGADIHASTLGILGMGRIGRAIARRGALGFGMRVVYHNRTRLVPELEAGAQWLSKEALLQQADHLMIVVPYSPSARHLVGAPELALMKRSATLTHVARGGVVDDVALIAALREGRLAAAGLDVFEGEPALHPDFLTLKNVVLTPHIASASLPTRRAMCQLAIVNLLAFLRGALGPTLLNP